MTPSGLSPLLLSDSSLISSAVHSLSSIFSLFVYLDQVVLLKYWYPLHRSHLHLCCPRMPDDLVVLLTAVNFLSLYFFKAYCGVLNIYLGTKHSNIRTKHTIRCELYLAGFYPKSCKWEVNIKLLRVENSLQTQRYRSIQFLFHCVQWVAFKLS